jgi:hypothetical protein
LKKILRMILQPKKQQIVKIQIGMKVPSSSRLFMGSTINKILRKVLVHNRPIPFPLTNEGKIVKNKR